MNLFDILKLRGFDLTARTKILRHQSSQYDIEEVFRGGYLNAYQSIQASDVLNCDYVVSFIARGQSKACFAGVWKVQGRLERSEVEIADKFPFPGFYGNLDDVHYHLTPVDGFEDLVGRIIIEWGKGTRSWHQWLKDKPVVEVLPRGYVSDFPGYLDIILSYDELTNLVDYPDANRVWHQTLSSVAAVYLITDLTTGNQYVGSAYGRGGLMARWSQYAKNDHGGNLKLRALLDTDPRRSASFQYTILQTLPASATAKETVQHEALYKRKLGSRSFGLDLN